VHIYRYVTQASFDGYSWQTLERKARFISQVIRGRLDAREIGDIGDTTLSYSEVKALARLHRSERAHARTLFCAPQARRAWHRRPARSCSARLQATAVVETLTRGSSSAPRS
jgi:hypothetical protein